LVHELPARLTAAYEKMPTHTQMKEIGIDRELDLAEVPHARRELARLAPFGVKNEKPLFVFPRTSIGKVRTFGKANDHLKFRSLHRQHRSASEPSRSSQPPTRLKKKLSRARAST